VKDARLVAEALRKKGFDVTDKYNLTSAQLKKAFEEFFILKGNEEEARLFVWFAGHGHTLDGEGYLVPVDASRPDGTGRFKLSALNMRRFGEFVRQANSKHVFNVFDSCFAGTVFNNQRTLPSAAITHATTQPVRQFLTSGDADQTVSDDGTFRKLFIRVLNGETKADANSDGYVTGSELGMFLTDRMTNLSRIKQTPRYGKLNHEDYDRGDFVFKLASLGKTPVAPISPTVSADIEFWKSVKDSDDPDMFEEYLRQHPKGDFAGLARLKIRKLGGEKQTASLTPPTVTIDDMDATYVAVKTANLRENPSAKSKKVGQIKIDTGLNVTGKVKGQKWYRISHAGNAAFIFAPLVKTIDPTELEAWEKVKDSKDATEFEGFLKAHPSGHFVDRAKRLREALKAVQVAIVTPPKSSIASPVKPAIGVYPQLFKLGTTLKDCPSCPEMVVIPAGSFRMGDLSGDGQVDERPVHFVKLLKSIAVGKFEVTQGEWRAVLGWNPSHFKGRRNPVERVRWNDVQSFVRKLSAKTGKKYRLLSEAEWEYAARAGTTTKFSWGNNTGRNNANCNGCGSLWDNKNTAPVGSFDANAFGLHDMHGNVWEWVGDCWNQNYNGAPTDGSVRSGSDCTFGTIRGGSWNYEPTIMRSAYRDQKLKIDPTNGLGFRIARDLDESDLKASNTNQPKQVAVVVPPKSLIPSKEAREDGQSLAKRKIKEETIKANIEKYSGVNFGKYYALVIGSNNYEYLPKLETAVSDAEEIAAKLQSSYEFEVKLLVDASRDDILDAFDSYRKILREEDNLLIYYAGHGWLDEAAEHGYWLPVDAKGSQRKNWVANGDLTTTLRALEAKHVLVMADSVFSGTLLRGVSLENTRGVSLENTKSTYIQRMAHKRARKAITSGGVEPVTDRIIGSRHSPFASVFLELLESNLGVMDATQMFSKMRRPVMLQAEQTPEFSDVRNAGHEGGDFLFVRRR